MRSVHKQASFERLEHRRLLSGSLPEPVIPADADRIAFLDFNLDGFSDVLGSAPLAGGDSQHFIKLGTGTGGLGNAVVNSAAPLVVTDVAAGDLNGDSADDNILIGPGAGTAAVDATIAFEDGGVRVFSTRPLQGSAPLAASDKWLAADFFGDGADGDVVRFSTDGTVEIFLGMGTIFEPQFMMLRPKSAMFAPGVTSVSTGDFDGNGWTDLLAISAGSLQLSLAVGCGSFQPPVELGNFPGANLIAGGRVNGDAHRDIVVGFANGSVVTLLNDGQAGFANAIVSARVLPGGTNKIDVGRFYGDQHADLLVHSSKLGIAKITAVNGKGTGVFPSQSVFSTPSAGQVNRGTEQSFASEIVDTLS